MNDINRFKRGYIQVSNELYVNYYDDIKIMFDDFRPTHIEFRHWENNTWYIWGISNQFEELTEVQQTPQYLCIFTHHDDGSITYEFKKS
jgi:hypothetical protein